MKELRVIQRCVRGCEYDGQIRGQFEELLGIGFYDVAPGIHIGDAFQREHMNVYCLKCGNMITYIIKAAYGEVN